MKSITVKNVVIGAGAPKIIVSLMGKDIQSIAAEAEYYRGLDVDIIELRIDFFSDIADIKQVIAALQTLRNHISDKPILFTFRTAKEGGEQAISPAGYIALNKVAVNSGLVDLIDLELFTGDELVRGAVEHAHTKGIKVIMSNHDFHATPSQDEIVARLRRMQDLGADIPKIAMMPQNPADVLTLLSATLDMQQNYADRPIITMSMSKTGIISRLAGEAFGSAATFGSAKKASAPGQIGVKELRAVLTLLHDA